MMDPNIVVIITMLFVLLMAIVGDLYFRFKEMQNQQLE